MKSIMVLWTKFPTKSRGILEKLICVSGFSKDSVSLSTEIVRELIKSVPIS